VIMHAALQGYLEPGQAWVFRPRSSVKGFEITESLKQKLSQLPKGFEWFLCQFRVVT
jgi:hypothetical protein